MKVSIKTTRNYEKEISKFLSESERYEMENQIAVDPLSWPVIRGTKGVRKARFSRGAVGKRGGGRVCYLYIMVHETVYFLSAYAKNEKEDLSEKSKKIMRGIVEEILKVMGDK